MNERPSGIEIQQMLEDHVVRVERLLDSVDRLIGMLDASPETVEFLCNRYGPIMWAIDHIREARAEFRSG